MSWRDKFEIGNLQSIITAALEQLQTSPLSKTDDVKKKRMAQQLKKDIRFAYNASKGSQIIDLANKEKSLYTTVDQVRHFVQVFDEPTFPGLEELLSKHAPAFEYAKTITDYGCGNAVKSSWIYNRLQELSQKKEPRELYLVDDNDILLQVAQNISTQLCDQTVILTKRKDIEEDHLIREKIDQPLLHFFLGQTIGNFKNPNPVVENIASSMKKEEYLVVEWFNRHFSEYEKGRQENGSYEPNSPGQRNLDFLYNYFEALGFKKDSLTTDQDGHFMSEERNWNIGYLILNQNFNHESGITLDAGTKLIGLRSRRFQEKEVISLFEKYGLEAQIADWNTEERERVIGPVAASMGAEPVDFPKTEEVYTNQKEWLIHNHQRYAIFKKVKEPSPSKLKIAGMGLLGAVVAAAVGLYSGNMIQKPVTCEDAIIDNLRIECPSKKMSVYISDLTNPVLKKDWFGEPMLEWQMKYSEYRFRFKKREDYKNVENALVEKKKLEKQLLARDTSKCVPDIICKDGETINRHTDQCMSTLIDTSLETSTNCIGDIGTSVRLKDLIKFYNQENMDLILQRLMGKMISNQNKLDADNIIEIFRDKRVRDMIYFFTRTCPSLKNNTITLEDYRWYHTPIEAQQLNHGKMYNYLINFVFVAGSTKDEKVKESAIQLVEYYGQNIDYYYQNVLAITSLVESENYLPLTNFSEYIVALNNLRNIPDQYVFALYVTEVARRIKEKERQPTVQLQSINQIFPSYDSEILYHFLSGLNNSKEIIPYIFPAIMNTLKLTEVDISQRIDGKEDEPPKVLPLAYYVQVTRKKCVQEEYLLKCIKDDKTCKEYNGKVINSIRKIENINQLLDQNFPFAAGLCKR